MGVVKPIVMRHPTQFRNMVEYLQNSDHPNHHVHKLHPPKSYGCVTADNIVEKSIEALDKINHRPGKRGRKLTTYATIFTVRFGNGSAMDPQENNYFDDGMAAGMVDDGGMVVYPHEILPLRTFDRNFGLTGWRESPLRARRTNIDDLYMKVCELTNKLLRDLNVKRRERGHPLIRLAGEARKKNARKKRGAKILAELMEAAKDAPVTFKNLVQTIRKLGHKVKTINPETDTISIIPKGRTKPIRLSIIWLLTSSAQKKPTATKAQTASVKQTLAAPPLPPPTPESPSQKPPQQPPAPAQMATEFDQPKVEDLERLIAETLRKTQPAPNPAKPPQEPPSSPGLSR